MELIPPEGEDYLDPGNLGELLPPEPAPARRGNAGSGSGPQVGQGQGGGQLAWPVSGQLSSRFGMRGGRMHEGIDIAGPYGREIRAAEAGTVVLAGWHYGYGRTVIVDHGNGLRTFYAHSSKLLVSEGQRVQKGEAIALLGSSGHSTGPHLHFEVHANGKPRNPLNYLN